MAHPQVIEGTGREISEYAAARADTRMVLIIPAEQEPQEGELPRRPEIVKTKERLEELLLEGLASPAQEVTDQEWVDLRQEVRDLLARRKQ